MLLYQTRKSTNVFRRFDSMRNFRFSTRCEKLPLVEEFRSLVYVTKSSTRRIKTFCLRASVCFKIFIVIETEGQIIYNVQKCQSFQGQTHEIHVTYYHERS